MLNFLKDTGFAGWREVVDALVSRPDAQMPVKAAADVAFDHYLMV